MKRFFALLGCLSILILSSCGSELQSETTLPAAEETTQAAETDARADVLSANDSYGEVRETDGIPVTDRSVLYRTADSVRLEPVAVRAARERIVREMAQPDSLQISNANVWNCMDDGTNVYYSFYFNCSGLVASGDRVRNVYYYDIGVRKADETTFDAADDTGRIHNAYSVFELFADRDSDCAIEEVTSDVFSSAARQIAVSRMKHPDSSEVLSVKERPDESDGTVSVRDVLCEGENDFGMRIPDVYTVYMRLEGDRIVEVDPYDY